MPDRQRKSSMVFRAARREVTERLADLDRRFRVVAGFAGIAVSPGRSRTGSRFLSRRDPDVFGDHEEMPRVGR
jgi:hypothetical protein